MSASCTHDTLPNARDTASTIPTLPPTTNIEPEGFRVGYYEGKAVVDALGWSGTESFVVQDEIGTVLCRWTWRTEHITHDEPSEPCATDNGDACSFWHTVQLQEGLDETPKDNEGLDCEAFRDVAVLLPDGGAITYGFATTDDGRTTKTAGVGRLLRYAWAEPPLPGAWLEFSEPAQWSNGELSYFIPVDMDLL